jgi:hypothetical protein
LRITQSKASIRLSASFPENGHGAHFQSILLFKKSDDGQSPKQEDSVSEILLYLVLSFGFLGT